MAYFTRGDGVDNRIEFPSPPTLLDNWAVRFKSRLGGGGQSTGFWSDDNTFTRIYQFEPAELETQHGGIISYPSDLVVEDGEFHLYELICVAGTTTLYIDKREIGTLSTNEFGFGSASTFNIHCAYRTSDSHADYYNNSDFAYLIIEDNGVVIRNWDASATLGTGTTIPDLANGFDGTMYGFATDDSDIIYLDAEEITPSHYARKVELTGPTTSSDLIGYSGLITEDNVPAEFWATVEDGGGDIRVSLNPDGRDQLPIQVVVCDVTNQIVRIFVRFPVYSTSLNSCWLFYGKAGETQHSLTSEYGQYSVWSDFYLVVHGITDLNDSTANNWTPTETGTIPIDTSLGMRISVSNWLSFPSIPILGNTNVSIGAIANTDWYDTGLIGSSLRGSTVFATRTTPTELSPTLCIAQAGDPTDNISSAFIADSDGLAAGSDVVITTPTGVDVAIDGMVARDDSSGKFDGVWTVVQDGTLESSNNVSLGGNYTFNRDFDGVITIGRHTEWDNTSTVAIKYLQLSKTRLPDDYILLKQNNYKTPGSFWTTGTPEDAVSSSSDNVNVTFVLLGVGNTTSDMDKDSEIIYSFGTTESISILESKNIEHAQLVNTFADLDGSLIKELDTTFFLAGTENITTVESKQGFDTATVAGTENITSAESKQGFDTATVAGTENITTVESKQGFDTATVAGTENITSDESKQTETTYSISSINNITVYVGSLLLVNATMSVINSSSISSSSSKSIEQNITNSSSTTLNSNWSIEKSLASYISNVSSLGMSQTKRLPFIYNSESTEEYNASHSLSKSVGFDVSSVLNNTQAVEIEKAINSLYSSTQSILIYLDTDQSRHIAISMQVSSTETLTSTEIINKLSQIDNILSASTLTSVSSKILAQSINYNLASELTAEFNLTKKVAAGITSANQLLSVVYKNTNTDIDNDSATTLLMQQTASRVAQTDFDISSISTTVLEIDIDKGTAYILDADANNNVAVAFNKELNAIQITTDSSITTILDPIGSDSSRNIIKVPVVSSVETHNISATTIVKPKVVQELTIVHDSVVPIRTTVLGGD